MRAHSLPALMPLVMLLLGLLPAGCAPRPTAAPTLSWNGSQLQGVHFYERVMERVTVHYGLSTGPETAEAAGQMADRYLAGRAAVGQVPPLVRIDLWLLPTGSDWPSGAPRPYSGSPARGVGPSLVLMREESVGLGAAQPIDPFLGFQPWNAIMVAATQSAESPVFSSGWLHEGMGRLLTLPVSDFPVRQWGRDFLGFNRNGTRPLAGADVLAVLEQSEARATGSAATRSQSAPNLHPLIAATALAALFVDRWGVDWVETHPLPRDAMTPEGALKWVTGSENTDAAVAAFDARMAGAIVQQVRNGNNVSEPVARAEMRPERMATVHVKAVNPTAGNGSGLAYRVAARFDDAARTLSGVQEVYWENRTGLSLDRLYFNLPNNGYRPVRLGARTEIRSVAAGGAPLSFKAKGLDLEVVLSRPLASGESLDLQIEFESRLPARVDIVRGPGRPVEQPAPSQPYRFTDLLPTLFALDETGWHPAPPLGIWTVELDVPTALDLKGPTLESRRTVGDRTVWRFAPVISGTLSALATPATKGR